MSRKAKSKGKSAATKLKSRRTAKGKTRPKKAVSARGAGVKSRNKTAIAKAKKRSVMPSAKKIVRIMGHGQFTVDSRTLKKLNDIDNAIVELVSVARSDDTEFKKRLTELSNMVVQNGKPLDPHEIIKSDIILPSADLSIDEAKKLFQGEGVIPEI
jgi:transcriptional regulator with XRE-family HTH domain